MHCSIFSEIACTPFKKLTDKIFFTKIFLPHFGRWYANVMILPNQLVPKQINLKNTTAQLQNFAKIFIKRPISTTSGLQS